MDAKPDGADDIGACMGPHWLMAAEEALPGSVARAACRAAAHGARARVRGRFAVGVVEEEYLPKAEVADDWGLRDVAWS